MAEKKRDILKNENIPLKTMILEELAKTSDSPEKDLQLIVNGWLSTYEHYTGNGDMGKFIKSVRSRVEVEDYIGAACLFIDKKSPIPLIGSVDRALKEERVKMRLFFTAEKGERVLIKDHASPTFRLGSAAHILMESLSVADGDLEKIRDKKIELEINKANQVIGISILESELQENEEGLLTLKRLDPSVVKKSQQQSFGLLEKGVPLFFLPKVKDEEVVLDTPVVKVDFVVPLDPPKENESVANWARRMFFESMETIRNHNGGLPSKPDDVEKIFDDEYAKTALMKILETAHVIFGVKSHLSLVNWSKDANNVIKYEDVDVFAVLNWLAIARKTLDLHKSPQISSISSIMSEVKEGPLRFEIKGKEEKDPSVIIPLQGNKIDCLRLSMEGKGKDRDWELQQVSEYLTAAFNSQDLKHRTYKMVNGVRKLVSTRLLRNTRTIFTEIYRHFGEIIFEKLVIDIDDFKFLGGDGNWSEQYDPSELPVESHKRQVSGYIFKVLSQLCWLRKTLDQRDVNYGVADEETLRLINFPEKEDTILTVEEVIDFGLKTGILNRIHGHLLYQLPTGEINCSVGPSGSNYEELIQWAHWATKLDNPKTNQRDRLRVVRGLAEIIKPLFLDMQIKRKENPKLPEYLTNLCVEWRDKFYLSVEDLWNQILRSQESKTLELINAIDFTAEGVKVLWFKGLVGGTSILRIAIDKNGSFAISNLANGEIIHGKLLTNKENKGVSQRPEKLLNSFNNNIWDMLKHFGLQEPVSYETPFFEEKMIMPDGSMEKLVKGKPIVCKYNLMTGKWYLDHKLLEEAVGTDGSRNDHSGIHELAQVLNKGGRKSGISTIWCPKPTHDNRRTKSAILNEDSINCQNAECGAHIYLPSKGKIRITSEPRQLTRTISDFKLISKERGDTFDALMKVGEVFARNNDRPIEYLVNERGVSPEDVGRFAYIPMDLNIALEGFVLTHSFRELSRKIKHKDTYFIDSFANLLKDVGADDKEKALDYYYQALEIVRSLPEVDRQVVYHNLNMKSLLGMGMRGILEDRTDEDKVRHPKGRLAERIILPTYWISSKSGLNLVQGNFNARGIEINGVIHYKDQPHHKAYLSKRGKVMAPTGFYIKDPQVFLDSVNNSKTVIVSEGPFNTASFSRMVSPEIASLNMTNMGTGYEEMVAFLRWMGVFKDKYPEGNELEMGIRTIVLSFDFDGPGASAFTKRKALLESEFPAVEVLPVHGFLPEDIRRILPQFNPDLFKAEKPLFGFKLDLNDILKRHGLDWAMENGISESLAEEMESLRLKYAYLPQ